MLIVVRMLILGVLKIWQRHYGVHKSSRTWLAVRVETLNPKPLETQGRVVKAEVPHKDPTND